jgi:hypothetical protein
MYEQSVYVCGVIALAKSLSTMRSKAGWNVVDIQSVGAFNEV